MFNTEYRADFGQAVQYLADLEPESECRFKKIKQEFECLNLASSKRFENEFPTLKNKMIKKVAESKGSKVQLYHRVLANFVEKHPDLFVDYDPKANVLNFKLDRLNDPKIEIKIDPKKLADPKVDPKALIEDIKADPKTKNEFKEGFLLFLETLLKILKIAVQVLKICGEVNAIVAA